MQLADDAGAPRVNSTLASEFRRLGHAVDTFSIDDARCPRSKVISAFASAIFRARAVQHVRAHSHRYDIVQAEQGNLPISKEELGLHGLLVSQSNGLAHFFRAFEKDHRSAAHRRRRGTLAGNALRRVAASFNHPIRAVEASFRYADLVVAANAEECRFISNLLGRDRVYYRPNGLSDAHLIALGRVSKVSEARLSRPLVAFIGSWDPRKGADEWPRIVGRIRRRMPHVKFLLLGTIFSEQQILSEFASEDRELVSVVPRFQPAELPQLLKNAAIGAFPSYAEACPLAVLEMLAGGLPVVAYDEPGSRQILRGSLDSLLVPAGQPDALADRVMALLSTEAEYLRLAGEGVRMARRFRWEDIAERTLAEYSRRLALVRNRNVRP